MKIIDIHIGCFGGLKNFKLVFEDGFQIIYGENGYGKTTIMSFFRLMLYGKNSKSRDLNQNLRKKYTPFDGSRMNGSMRFELNGQIIRIEKEFGKTQANDVCYVFNENLGREISIPAGMDVGEYLLGMEERTFEKVIYGGSTDGGMVSTGRTDEIMVKLVNAGTSGDEDISIHNILEELAGEMESLKSKRGVSGSIPRLNEDIARLKEEKANLIQRKKELEQIEKKDLSAVHKERILLQKLITRMKKEENSMEENDEVDSGADGRKSIWHRLVLTVCMISGIFLMIFGNRLGEKIPWFMMGLILLCTGGFIFLLETWREKHVGKSKNASENYSEKMSELMEDLGYNGYSLEDLIEREQELADSQERDTPEIIRNIQEELEKCMESIQAAYGKRDELTEEYESYKIALSVMKECADELRSSISEPLNHTAGEIFSELTENQYDGFMVDEQYQIRVREKDSALYREWKTLSQGTANQAYLALRIAMNELYSGQEAMPLLLDDVLANYDEWRAERAIQILRKKNRQVILFTCHGRNGDSVRNDA